MPKTFHIARTIAAPADRVFELMTDLPNAAERIRGIDKVEILTDGPFGVGTRFRETRTMFGKQAVETMEVTEHDPANRSYVLEASSHGCHYRTLCRAVPEGAGTRAEFEMTAMALTLPAKILSTVMGPLMKGAVCKAVGQDLDDLKSAAEKPTA